MSLSQDGADFIHIVKINIVSLSTKVSLLFNDIPQRVETFYLYSS